LGSGFDPVGAYSWRYDKDTFVGGLLSPEREFFPEYDAGKYQVNGKILIVNRGLGNGDFGIRVFNPPEISVIMLSN